jgi:hypothetical protein
MFIDNGKTNILSSFKSGTKPVTDIALLTELYILVNCEAINIASLRDLYDEKTP